MHTDGFWGKLDQLVATCPLVIDRPKGLAHPRYPDLIYPLDYGYLENTKIDTTWLSTKGNCQMTNDQELQACIPVSVNSKFFNPDCLLPYGLTVEHIYQAMADFVDFLGFINQQLYTKRMPRLESFLMPANFSSIVGEFMNISIPKYCSDLVKNQYHNGHPDLIPRGMFPDDAVQHTQDGIEVKGSRHASGWQGHNPESVWLLVFYFDSNTSNDKRKGVGPKPFRFKGVYAAKLEKGDWTFSGRSATSRRTITASVNRNAVERMKANWVFKDLDE